MILPPFLFTFLYLLSSYVMVFFSLLLSPLFMVSSFLPCPSLSSLTLSRLHSLHVSPHKPCCSSLIQRPILPLTQAGPCTASTLCPCSMKSDISYPPSFIPSLSLFPPSHSPSLPRSPFLPEHENECGIDMNASSLRPWHRILKSLLIRALRLGSFQPSFPR